jgi:hypothetical protein
MLLKLTENDFPAELKVKGVDLYSGVSHASKAVSRPLYNVADYR